MQLRYPTICGEYTLDGATIYVVGRCWYVKVGDNEYKSIMECVGRTLIPIKTEKRHDPSI